MSVLIYQVVKIMKLGIKRVNEIFMNAPSSPSCHSVTRLPRPEAASRPVTFTFNAAAFFSIMAKLTGYLGSQDGQSSHNLSLP